MKLPPLQRMSRWQWLERWINEASQGAQHPLLVAGHLPPGGLAEELILRSLEAPSGNRIEEMGKEENEPSHEESEVIRSTNTASYLTDVAVTKVMKGSGAPSTCPRKYPKDHNQKHFTAELEGSEGRDGEAATREAKKIIPMGIARESRRSGAG